LSRRERVAISAGVSGRRVVVCHGSIVPRDAIGNDVAGMVTTLASHGDVAVFGEHVHRTDLPRLDRAQLDALIASPENTIVYHHSIAWPLGEEIHGRARAQIIVKDHNITPPELVAAHAALAAECRGGREQTARLRAAHPAARWLADSAFNLADAGLPPDPGAVVPPFHVVESWAATTPAPAVVQALAERDDVRLLAVGRHVASKRLETLVDVVADYRRHHGPRIRLNVVGTPLGDDDPYHRALRERVAALGLDRHVRFLGQVADDELLALYRGSHYLVCASAHEGFCVPIVEAQALGLPVVAVDVPAVRETAGDAQLLLGSDPAELAEAVAMLEATPSHRDALIAAGRANFERRFGRAAIERRFRAAVGADR
jgi:glycosyltransferase involved in cell wall biosynthesis